MKKNKKLEYIIQNTLFMLRNMYSRFDGGSPDHIYLKTVKKPAMEMYLFSIFNFAMKYCFSFLQCISIYLTTE